MQENRESPTNG